MNETLKTFIESRVRYEPDIDIEIVLCEWSAPDEIYYRDCIKSVAIGKPRTLLDDVRVVAYLKRKVMDSAECETEDETGNPKDIHYVYLKIREGDSGEPWAPVIE